MKPVVKNDTEPTDGLAQLLDTLDTWSTALPNLPTDRLVTGYGRLAKVEKGVESFKAKLRATLLERKDEGGTDSKGHVYLGGADGDGLKLERRMSIKLKDDARQTLQEYGLLGFFPLRPNPEKMLEQLRILGVDPDAYCDREVTKDLLEKAVESGVVPTGIAVECIETSETLAFKAIDRKELPREVD